MYWNKWAGKHEHEELEEGAWIEPALALLRNKVKGDWTEKHCNVARKLFLEGGWTRKRLFDIGWSDVSKCQACQLEEGTEKHRLQNGTRSGGRFWRPSESGSTWRERRRKSGSGKEVSSRTLSVKADGTEAISV